MTTIKDVARLAGVSFKSVSRVVNGEPNVGPDLRRRIEAAIRELNYRPTLAARQMKSNRTFIVTLIVPQYVSSYISRMMFAMAAECRAVGYHLVTEIVGDLSAPDEQRALPDFSVRSDAAILLPPFSDYPAIMSHLSRLGIPVVRIASVDVADPRVIPVDDTRISVALVEHLLSLGHRRIGMIAPPLPEIAAETRLVGYREAIERAGLPFDPDLVVRGNFMFGSGVEAATRLLALSDRPTAIFAASDEMALGAMALVTSLGHSVPGTIAIAGFDDAPESRMVWPPLTTVYQPIRAIAKAAIHAATGRGEAPAEMHHRLIVRGSTTGAKALCLDPYGE